MNSINYVPIIYIALQGGIHRYHESRRCTYNDSQPSRVNVAKENSFQEEGMFKF